MSCEFVHISAHVVPSCRLRQRRHRAGADRRDRTLRGRHRLSLTPPPGVRVATFPLSPP
ncbi:hypothetical protein SGPA1_11963 [Streptomyces misionensis JCM 4497]